MSLPLRVLGPRVLIKPEVKTHAPEQTESGIFLAQTLSAAATGEDVVQWYDSGVIVALGDADAPFDVRPFVLRRLTELEINAWGVPPLHTITADALQFLRREIEALPARKVRDFNLGDRVTFSWEAGQQVTIDGEVYLVMAEDDILAVVSEESA